MESSEIIALIRDLILAAAAITGAVVAVKGLGAWKAQLKGRHEYDLARSLLVNLFKYRDAIKGVRNPIMFEYEMPAPPENEAKEMSREDVRFYGNMKAYQSRWDKVQGPRTELYTGLLEAEAIWGKTLKGLFQPIRELENELFRNIQNHLQARNPKTEAASQAAIRQIRRKKREVLYDMSSDDPDDFTEEFNQAVEMIEGYLKPKLVR